MAGVKIWKNLYDIQIFRLHYSADPAKDAAWAAERRRTSTSEAMFRQEYEIDFQATLGALIYNLTDEYTLEDSFPIPDHWTRYYSLDPHPVKPHASLWGACDPYGDLWIYREFWPSKVYNQPGSVPEEDNRVLIKPYVECIQWLESSGNPENNGRAERIYTRVIDYAARAFGKGTTDDPTRPNFETRFQEAGRELDFPLYFDDAKKDHDTGYEAVNRLLMPRKIIDPVHGECEKSRIRIFRDKCPELVYQLKTNRRQMLTPSQEMTSDPQMKAIAKRNDLTDCLRYMVMADPQYVRRPNNGNTFKPSYDGFSY